MKQSQIDIKENNLILEMEKIATTVQSLANAMILLSSNVANDPRLNSAIEEIASIVEGKSESLVKLTSALEVERKMSCSKRALF